MINMELVRRRTWIFFDIKTDLYISLRRRNACKGEVSIIIATFPWMRVIFPEKRENLKSRTAHGHFVPYRMRGLTILAA
jgi:hypothetical protein